ncbi:GDSL-type esterase/lipase family protein [Myxacorys almedinensis]|uniref:Lysophospholipase n=1 Tax=Myxacorys almedinensis A TaxID=2690445 RepID=A0A8J8CJ41_9CYAN|nr:GDSL-type esterase/lipase family protein [Myxacorys almedinensis]NDJ17196.1 lysophospholipase [Myxacorys almedinensis A]
MQTKPSHSKTRLKTRSVRSATHSPSSGFLLSLAANIILGATLLVWFLGDSLLEVPEGFTSQSLLDRYGDESDAAFPEPSPALSPAQAASAPKSPTLNTQPSNQRLNYDQWIEILTKEAKAAVKNKPDRLMVLAGDSLSLWFPAQLLPNEYLWLNQGISGESSTGLLKRLKLFAKTNPQAIFVMIGINDLTKGVSDQVLLDRYSQMLKDLRQTHPNSKIVMQSILPRADEPLVTADSRQQLLKISNDRIRKINQKLAALSHDAGADYLDLQPMFADEQGFLRPALTTDGLHLSQQGYLVWRAALGAFNQTHLTR